MARVLPPRRPMHPQNCSTRRSGSRSRKVSGAKTSRSLVDSGSPIIAISKIRHDAHDFAR